MAGSSPRLRVRNFLATARVAGPLRWLHRSIRLIPRRARLNRNYDRWTVEIMGRVLGENSSAIDVGCHRGAILREMLRIAPAGRHHAFEPLPEYAEGLRRDFPSVTVHEVALSDTDGSAEFRRVVDCPGYSGLQERAYPRRDVRIETVTVRLAKLDDLIPPEPRITFVKVDVEGGELQVFRGATALLSRDKPYVVFEHGSGAAPYYGTRPEMVFDLLVGTCGLKLSLMNDWLRGRPALTREVFVSHFDRRRNFYFLAHP